MPSTDQPGPRLTETLDRTDEELDRIKGELTAISERARAGLEEVTDEATRTRLARVGELMEMLRIGYLSALDEALPAPPISEMHGRLGTAPASEEQFEAFLSGHEVPAESE